MSLHYLLDGYNILKKTPGLNNKTLEDGRKEFIRLIQVHRPQGSVNNSITIVFDGQSGYWQDERPSDVKVIFSVNSTADDKIKDIVNKTTNKKSIVVVTDDNELKYFVRGLGTQILSVEGFQAQFKTVDLTSNLRVARSAKRKDRSLNEKVSHTQAHAINKEFEEIWVKRNKKEK